MNVLKNKSSVAALLVVAAMVWGVVIFRIVSFRSGGQAGEPAGERGKPELQVKADTLILNYRDPFLGPCARKPVAAAAIPRRGPLVEATEEVPLFRYAGKIRKGKCDFLLIVCGEEVRLVPEREKSIGGFRVERVYNDSLWVCKNKKRYTVRME